MLSTASTVRIVVSFLALGASGGALFFFGLPEAPHELPVNAGSLAASRPTVSPTSLAQLSDAGNEFTLVFDIARMDEWNQRVRQSSQAGPTPGASVELLRNGYVHDQAVADSSGQFVMVPPRLPSGDYELTLRSRLPDGKEATSKKSVLITLQGRVVHVPLEGFLTTMDVSCWTFIRMAHLAEPLMKRGGTLFTMTYYGSQMVVKTYNIIGFAKAALESAVRYIAAELGPKGIRVHAISPGPLATRAASGIPEFDGLLDKAKTKAPARSLVSIKKYRGIQFQFGPRLGVPPWEFVRPDAVLFR
jgi:NAD(P)-dependent dehydrogenase (short-subunit alcohol dehydrogenase family)